MTSERQGGGAGEGGPHLSRAERRRRARRGDVIMDQPKSGIAAVRETMRTGSFRLASAFLVLGLLVVAIAESSGDEYGFLQLGWLFTLSVYDLVLAMLGLSVVVAMAATARHAGAILAVFAGVLLAMLFFFDATFSFLRSTPLGGMLYLIAPTAVVSPGIVLWLPDDWRDYGGLVAAAVVAFSFSLFVGLDDIGVGIADFASGAFFCAVWLVAAPAFVLRQFRGRWLRVPARIVGSWLIVIAMIVTAALYMPELPVPPVELGGNGEGAIDEGLPTVPQGAEAEGR